MLRLEVILQVGGVAVRAVNLTPHATPDNTELSPPLPPFQKEIEYYNDELWIYEKIEENDGSYNENLNHLQPENHSQQPNWQDESNEYLTNYQPESNFHFESIETEPLIDEFEFDGIREANDDNVR